MVTSSNALWLEFITDEVDSARGFQLKLRATSTYPSQAYVSCLRTRNSSDEHNAPTHICAFAYMYMCIVLVDVHVHVPLYHSIRRRCIYMYTSVYCSGCMCNVEVSCCARLWWFIHEQRTF